MNRKATDIFAQLGIDEGDLVGFKTVFHIRCSLERCWDFWTREEHVRSWLATEAFVDCHPGGDYIIHSRIPFQSGRHRLDELREKSFLSFTWFMEGFPSRLNVAFEAHAEGVSLTLEQLASPTPPPGIFRGYDPLHLSFQSQSWGYAISRLRSVLEEGHTDMEIPNGDKHDEVNWAIEIAASRDAIFSALTEFTELRKWEGMCMESGSIEKRNGGRYSFGWESEYEHENGDGPGHVEEYNEGHELAYSWFGDTPTTVRWNLTEATGGKTRLSFRHAKFQSHPYVVWEYKLGWSVSLFALKWYLEQNEGHGSWFRRKEMHA